MSAPRVHSVPAKGVWGYIYPSGVSGGLFWAPIRVDRSGYVGIQATEVGMGIADIPGGSETSGISYTYNNSGYLVSGEWRDMAGAVMFHLRYTYDTSGNLTDVVRY